MKNLYCVICGKDRKFEKPKISYHLEKSLVLSIIGNKYKNEDEQIGFIWFNWKYISTLKYKSRMWIKKYRRNKKLLSWRNKVQWIDE